MFWRIGSGLTAHTTRVGYSWINLWQLEPRQLLVSSMRLCNFSTFLARQLTYPFSLTQAIFLPYKNQPLALMQLIMLPFKHSSLIPLTRLAPSTCFLHLWSILILSLYLRMFPSFAPSRLVLRVPSLAHQATQTRSSATWNSTIHFSSTIPMETDPPKKLTAA